jgi:hypothetical protein
MLSNLKIKNLHSSIVKYTKFITYSSFRSPLTYLGHPKLLVLYQWLKIHATKDAIWSLLTLTSDLFGFSWTQQCHSEHQSTEKFQIELTMCIIYSSMFSIYVSVMMINNLKPYWNYQNKPIVPRKKNSVNRDIVICRSRDLKSRHSAYSSYGWNSNH